MLTRSFLPQSSSTNFLAYTPMLHARLFAEDRKYRDKSFEAVRAASAAQQSVKSLNSSGSNLDADGELSTSSNKPQSALHLDGNPSMDRPLFVQFCANSPEPLLQAARHVAPYCDAVDLNLGCPQGIARKGHYGAFLQEDWSIIHSLIRTLHDHLAVPVTAKMRILESKEKSLEYAKMILDAGASVITVHGRQREQKGHYTGVADWSVLRYMRDNLPPETVIFANGNILQHEDIELCLEQTRADGVMSAEANLHDPSIFAQPPPLGQEGVEYWRGRDGKGGFRVDAVLRRYMDIIHMYALEQEPPERKPLFVARDLLGTPRPRDGEQNSVEASNGEKRSADQLQDEPSNPSPSQHEPQTKKQKRKRAKDRTIPRTNSPNLLAMQAHLFNLLRPLVSRHHNVRDALAQARAGDIVAYENVLSLTEEAVKQGIADYEVGIYDDGPVETKKKANQEERQQEGPSKTADQRQRADYSAATKEGQQTEGHARDPEQVESSDATIQRCKRPWWICQPYIRPLPAEAIRKGAITLGQKDRKRVQEDHKLAARSGLPPEGTTSEQRLPHEPETKVAVPRQGMVCG